jgi:NADH:ubiquinone oxidoreductase subunit
MGRIAVQSGLVQKVSETLPPFHSANWMWWHVSGSPAKQEVYVGRPWYKENQKTQCGKITSKKGVGEFLKWQNNCLTRVKP